MSEKYVTDLGSKTFPLKDNLWVETEHPDKGLYLLGSKCGLCGEIFFPATKVCLKCINDEDIKEVKIKGRGKLYTYTEIKRAAPGFATPYFLGFIDLQDGPRVLFQIGDCDGKDLHIGIDMEAFIGQIREDVGEIKIMGPKFRPFKKCKEGGK